MILIVAALLACACTDRGPRPQGYWQWQSAEGECPSEDLVRELLVMAVQEDDMDTTPRYLMHESLRIMGYRQVWVSTQEAPQ